MNLTRLVSILILLLGSSGLYAQTKHAPEWEEGLGPYNRLIIRGVNLIDGTGSPMFGPVDIVIEGNRITRISKVGSPGFPINPDDRPKNLQDGFELDATGMYALPGFIDMHGHIGGTADDVTAEYVYKLWMAHGITTIRDPGSGNGLDWVLSEKKFSQANAITAPRIFAYTFFGQGASRSIKDAEGARAWVQENAKKGADGVKFFWCFT